jgi:hypothetical protein
LDTDKPITGNVTIYIANGLDAGSQNLLTLHEAVPISLGFNHTTQSYQFAPVHLRAGTYYLILTATKGSFAWNENSPGSTEVGILGKSLEKSGSEFGPGWHRQPCETAYGHGCVTNNTMAFQLDLVKRHVPVPPVGVTVGQIIHLTAYAGPVLVPPGVPVEATVGFVDVNGRALGPTTRISLPAGQATSVDLNADAFIGANERRIQILPIISDAPADPAVPSLRVSVEVVDAGTRGGTVLATTRTATSFPAALEFSPQGLAGGQTLRLNVAAAPSGTCTGVLSFLDRSGTPIGGSTPARLAPGTATSLSLKADSLGLHRGQRIDVVPMVSAATSNSTSPPIEAHCLGSAEVFDDATERTSTYQTATSPP